MMMEHEKIFDRMSADMDEWMSKGYPLSDPSWDYAQLWEFIHETFKPEFENFIREIQQHEDATPETDKAILVRLQWLQTCIDRCKSYLTISND